MFGSYTLCALPGCGAWGAVGVRVGVRRVSVGTPYTLCALPALGLAVDWGLELASGAHFLTPLRHCPKKSLALSEFLLAKKICF